MFDYENVNYSDVQRASDLFHRDGFVVIHDALTHDQFEFVEKGVSKVVAKQMKETPLIDANRGYARYTFGNQADQPAWVKLIDMPTILPILDAIFGSIDYICSSCSGDFNGPGAQEQFLHKDIEDNIFDPINTVSLFDMPTPWLVVNYLLTDVHETNGPIRIIPHTHRTRLQPPLQAAEPKRMKTSTICAPKGTVIIRDVRCWHGGTDNRSDEIRAMVDVGYFAPWYRVHGLGAIMPKELFDTLSPRGQAIARYLARGIDA